MTNLAATLARCIAVAAFLVIAGPAYAATDPCTAIPHADHPTARLSNGEMTLVVFLPDATNGYYRSSRFDWSGIIACASYRGHSFFGEWFKQYDPMANDAVTGPAEEFRAEDGQELGFAEAPAGGTFVKPGVGVLRKTDDKPYSFGTVYPIVDGGTWKVKVEPRSITFTQRLESKLGYAYVYTKTLTLDPRAPVFTLSHSLRNTGTKLIRTSVYDHDFFMLDGKPTGPQNTVTLGFTPIAEKPLGSAAEIRGKQIAFTATPDHDHTAMGYLTGFTGASGEYSAHLTDSDTGVGILQTSPSPVAKSYFWSIATTVCPELYIAINVSPGNKQTWQIRYQLEAPPPSVLRNGINRQGFRDSR